MHRARHGAVAMVALHADKLPQWRERMQKDLVQDIDQGLRLDR